VTLIEALVLGLIQGLTEFLPISSSAHVQIAQELMGTSSLSKPQLTAFIATIQIGTELAVIGYFARTILGITKSFISDSLKPWREQNEQSRLGWLIILGTLPMGIVGLSLQQQIEQDVRQLRVIAITLIVFGVFLGVADLLGRKKKTISELDVKSGLAFGFGQALALIPGVSRSGGSITVGLLIGFTREAAARYSFLLAIPAVLTAGAYQFVKSFGDLPSDLLAATLLATLISFISGLAVIAWLLKYLVRGSYLPFVIWRILVGGLLLVLLNTNPI
jgi:undecaprenyl-diphosphatase